MIKAIYRFFSPKFQTISLDYHVDVRPRYGHGKPPHPELNTLIKAHTDTYTLLLNKATRYGDNLIVLEESKEETSQQAPTWNNGFLPSLDILMLYTMISEYKPKNYIEIGSGNSTKVVRKAIIEIISILRSPLSIHIQELRLMRFLMS